MSNPYILTYHIQKALRPLPGMMEDTGLDTLKRMFICNLAHQVLTKNYFQFNGQLYIQKQGTAMGS